MREEYGNSKEKGRKKYRYIAVTGCMIGLCLIFCTALFFYSSRIQEITRKQAESILKEAAGDNARMLEYEIDNKMTLFQRMADQWQGGYLDKNQVLEKLEPLLELYAFKDVGLVTADGSAVSVRDGRYDLREAEFFQRTMRGEVVFTPTMLDKNDGSWINIYSAPIFEDEQIVGVIYAVYSTEKFTELFTAPFEGASYSYVVDSSGDVMIAENGRYENIPELIRNFSTANKKAAEKAEADLKAGRPGGVTYKAADDRYAYYSPIGINGWSVVTIVPVWVVMKQYQPVIETTRFFCIFMGCLCLAAAGYFLRQQRKQNKRLEAYAYVDPLTGGKNNTRFMLDAVSVLKEKRGKNIAFLSVDINHFKRINQLLGIEAGNRAICELEGVLRESSRGMMEPVGHRGADRFMVLWLYETTEELHRRLKELCNRLERLSENMESIHFQASVGVYEVSWAEAGRIDEGCVEQLCGNAMLAGQTLKCGHTTACALWDDEMRKQQLQSKLFEDEMYPALARKEFVPWFQPKVDLKTGRMIGAEALVRWQKADGTLISPGSFIPFFETNGFIEKVDLAVMEAVCRYLKAWKAKGLKTVPISVNLSRMYLYSETFAREWREYLEKNELDITDVQFEITETFAARDKELMKKAINALHNEGFQVLLDDFGTGYSSLAALQELNFDVLKLDCKFIWGIGESRTETILENVIHMAGTLEMETIAEGVETEEQYEYLKIHGVDMIQGYYCYRPMPADEFEKLLR